MNVVGHLNRLLKFNWLMLAISI